jgi:hypothetical protein
MQFSFPPPHVTSSLLGPAPSVKFIIQMEVHINVQFLSFLGSTAQRRPWPPQNPAEFLGGFSTIFFFTG